MRTSDPGTIPPPSTRENSRIGTARRETSALATSWISTGSRAGCIDRRDDLLDAVAG